VKQPLNTAQPRDAIAMNRLGTTLIVPGCYATVLYALERYGYLTYDILARLTGLKRQTLYVYAQRLEEYGLLKREGGGPFSATQLSLYPNFRMVACVERVCGPGAPL